MLDPLVEHIADAVCALDSSGLPFKAFQCGVGPYGEPQLVRAIAAHLNNTDPYRGLAVTKRAPDLLIRGLWALEFKIARPFGDNGREAENWSVNLLHPYPGNVSVISDCLKLMERPGVERRAVVVVGYEHTPPHIPLEPLFSSFEAIAHGVAHIPLSPRAQVIRRGLVHPIHQQVTIASWEVVGSVA